MIHLNRPLSIIDVWGSILLSSILKLTLMRGRRIRGNILSTVVLRQSISNSSWKSIADETDDIGPAVATADLYQSIINFVFT
jgi:hypothetical protein